MKPWLQFAILIGIAVCVALDQSAIYAVILVAAMCELARNW